MSNTLEPSITSPVWARIFERRAGAWWEIEPMPVQLIEKDENGKSGRAFVHKYDWCKIGTDGNRFVEIIYYNPIEHSRQIEEAAELERLSRL